jgi:hypothetical protein
MACAANYAWANRQIMMHLARETFLNTLHMSPNELGMKLLFSYFTSIRFEQRAGIPADSLIGAAAIERKLASVRVTSFSGEQHSMQVFSFHETPGSKPHLFRALVLYNDEQDALFVNYIYLDVLMRGLSHYFGEK